MDRPTPPGQSGCVCAACWRVFSTPSAFDKHQRWDATGVVCHDPADTGLAVLRTHQDRPLWGWPRKGAGPETRRSGP